jgi:hypothetical protein
MKLAPHIATADEPIEPLGHPDRWNGPDMRTVTPIDEMLKQLHQFDDDVVSYVALWRKLIASVGNSVSLSYDRDGERSLGFCSPADPQIRHRSRWMHFLVEDFWAVPDRVDYLMDLLHREGRYSDNRPRDPRSTTAAVRAFLRTQGRIMLDPDGDLQEGGELPSIMLKGTPEQIAECKDATRAYYDVRRRWRSEAQIKRAVRMLGKRTKNGWIVLEGRGGALEQVVKAARRRRSEGATRPKRMQKAAATKPISVEQPSVLEEAA